MNAPLEPGHFLKSVPFKKVDEAKQEAWGVFTAEVPDSDNEIADYEYQKGKVSDWSKDCQRKAEAAGAEKTLGNVRFSHTITPTGKVIALDMKDAERQIVGGTYLMNVGETKTWDMVQKGILQGFSFGGHYDWRKCAQCGQSMPLEQANNFCGGCDDQVPVRYGATIAELSVCDRPAVPVANILHIKADGSQVVVKTEGAMDKAEKKTKRVAGEDLTADCFAYVGDPDKTDSWKLPIKGFSSDDKTKRHIRNALARFNQTKGIPDDEKAKVKAKIVAAARAHGIDVSEDEDKAERFSGRSYIKAEVAHIQEQITAKAAAAGVTLRKDLSDVANMAELLQRIAWLRYSAVQEREYEGDDTDLPEKLEQNLIDLSETFLAMAEEETAELVAAAKKTGKVTTMEKANIEMPANIGDLLTGHIVDMAAHHEVLADAHKALHEHHKSMAGHHTEHAATHKAIHEHFKAAAEEGGDGAEHHAMHADAHKAHHEHHKAMAEHHETKAAHHLGLHKACKAHAEKCSKLAEEFAPTPERKAAIPGLIKTAKDALPKPTVTVPATPAPKIDLANMSDAEKAAYARIQTEYYASAEYAKKVRDSLDAQTAAKLAQEANSAALVVGVDPKNDGVYAVPRPGQVAKQDTGDGVTADQIFDLAD